MMEAIDEKLQPWNVHAIISAVLSKNPSPMQITRKDRPYDWSLFLNIWSISVTKLIIIDQY